MTLTRAQIKDRVERRIWTTREGDLIPIEKLDDDHLLNCIKMLRRKGCIELSTWEFYFCTAGPSGEMASMLFEQELDYILKKHPSQMLDHLVDEWRKRNPGKETP